MLSNIFNIVVVIVVWHVICGSRRYGIISVVFTLKVYIISYIVTADGKEYAHVSLH